MVPPPKQEVLCKFQPGGEHPGKNFSGIAREEANFYQLANEVRLMRDIQQVLEKWGGWAASDHTAISWSPVAAGFKGLLPATPARPRPSCSDDDGLTIDACVCRLRAVRASGELNVIMAYYVWGMSKRAIGRALRTSEGRVRQQLQVAEGFVAGCLEMTGARLEMDDETGTARIAKNSVSALRTKRASV